MKEIIKQSTDLYYEIDDCITKLLKARLDKDVDKEHESFCKMESLMVETMQHISWLVGELKGNSQIKWQTGKPIEEGYNLITTNYGHVTLDHWMRKYNEGGSYYDWSLNNGYKEVRAWCNLNNIEPCEPKYDGIIPF